MISLAHELFMSEHYPVTLKEAAKLRQELQSLVSIVHKNYLNSILYT